MGVLVRVCRFFYFVIIFLESVITDSSFKDQADLRNWNSTAPNRRSRIGIIQPQESSNASRFRKPSIPFWTLQAIDNGQDCKNIHRFCKHPSSDSIKGKFSCSCTSTCSQFGDCCLDAEPENIDQLECVQIETKQQPPGIALSMVTKCIVSPESQVNGKLNQDEETRQLCENVTADSSFEQNVPVSSSSSLLTFKNIYCALCNNVPGREWRFWTLNSNCLLSEELTIDQALQQCKFKFIAPAEMTSPPFCDSQVIGTCPPGWHSLNDTMKCEQYYAPVSSRSSNRTFKNKFCAYCHNASQVVCESGSQKPVPVSVTPLISSTLSLLLDLDAGQGDDDRVGSTSLCPEGFQSLIWRPICPRCKVKRTQFIRCFPVHMSPNDSLNCTNMDVQIRAEVAFTIDANLTLTFTDFGEKFAKGEYKLLSNSSVIICTSRNAKYAEKFSYTQRVLTVVCLTISVVCLSIHVVLLVKKRPLSVAKCVRAFLCCSLIASHVLFLISNEGWSKPVCVFLAVSNHYAQLMSLTWSLMLALDMFRTFSRSFQRHDKNGCKLRNYVFAAVFLPAVPVSMACVIEFASDWEKLRPQYGPELCWLSNRNALLIFFAVPLGALFLANLYLFVNTACKIVASARFTEPALQTQSSQWKRDMFKLVMYSKLALLMSLTWAFGLVAAYGRNDVLWYLFIIGHGLQGAFLLLAFTPCQYSCKREKPFRVKLTRKALSLHDLQQL